MSSAPLEEGACEAWYGNMWGNDANVKTRLVLCRRGNEVCGQLNWSGQSGESVREIKGALEAGALELRDVKFIRNAPKNGWRFCLIDRYRLVKNERSGNLDGRYESRECNDRAELTLLPVAKQDRGQIDSCFAQARRP